VAGHPYRPRDENLTLRIDAGVLLWARMRALMDGTSVNRLIREHLREYARIPPGWLEGQPPPWDPPPEDR
jgi:predicted HicB family RNase H-like nuclease